MTGPHLGAFTEDLWVGGLPEAPPHEVVDPPPPSAEVRQAEAGPRPVILPNLPDDFWEGRARLRTIRHVGHIKHPGRYAQAIVDDDGEDRLWEVAADILYESAEIAANGIMAEMSLPEGVDRDVVANWLTHALSADVPLTHLLPTLFRLADHGVLGTNAYVEAIKQVCPGRAA